MLYTCPSQPFLVSSRNAPNLRGEERCVTILKTAARETNNNAAEGGKSIKY